MLYQIAAILLLLAFYSIYIGKLVSQKRKGIQTNQMARCKKSGRVYFVELALAVATYSIVVAQAFCILLNQSLLPPLLRMAGGALAFFGVVIFAISVWTMRDSWRAGIATEDKTEMITTGIYAWSRNPAFLGFDLLYSGILLLFFHWVLLLFSVFAMAMLHLQVLQEERFLPLVFGPEYTAYRQRTHRYFGKRKA